MMTEFLRFSPLLSHNPFGFFNAFTDAAGRT